MKNKETVFVCSNCGNEFGKWAGQCSGCGEWNSLKEVKSFSSSSSLSSKRKRVLGEKLEVRNLGKMDNENLLKPVNNNSVFSTTIGEFDRVLGKGIVQGSAVLFAGEPGIGKSTLLTQLIGKIGGLYVAGEESAEQIGLRVKRLGLNANNFDVLGTNSIDELEEFLDRTQKLYKIAVVDSIQVMNCENATGVIGSVSQIKESTFRLIQMAKKKGMAIFIVGHVTKDGDIAGPKLLEHMVDTVLYFEGEKNGDLRILRTSKNRFGPTDEVGVFKMEEKGLREIKSEEINLIENGENKIGSAVTVVMEGTRPMILEIQALVVESFAPMPKRIFSGIDYNRGQLMIAIAQKSLGVPLYKYDVFLSVTGGVKIEETAADLAVLVAIWSSYKSTPTPSFDKEGRKTLPVWVGEVSLLGEVRKVRNLEKRKKEAESLGRKLVEIRNVSELKT
ncbi:MAG: DNA repair protein RadA [Candidatus Shapirobacteria bacterium]|nr:DNA repair protein RadA [Candidatus Shapirobacteria bacterium]MDD4382869.1 DNA repair protein RadA [Candidatus Shapirobacteria bacterium]